MNTSFCRCPKCRDICTCFRCRKSKGLEATRSVAYFYSPAMYDGFHVGPITGISLVLRLKLEQALPRNIQLVDRTQ
jgi:hypothetical protein